MWLKQLSNIFSPQYHFFRRVSTYQERELDATSCSGARLLKTMCCYCYCTAAAAATATPMLTPLLPLLMQRQQQWQHGCSCLQAQRRWRCRHCYWFCFCFYFCLCFCCSTPMGLWCPTSFRPRLCARQPRLSRRRLSLAPSSCKLRQICHQW